jgi:hypothetical protein
MRIVAFWRVEKNDARRVPEALIFSNKDFVLKLLGDRLIDGRSGQEDL